MPNITFSNSDRKDITVYIAAVSHIDTILKIAKANKVPINFDCGDGECGSCAIKVRLANSDVAPMGVHVTDKEKLRLKELGRISQDDIERMIVTDLPCEWRLACQFIPRDEDIVVEY